MRKSKANWMIIAAVLFIGAGILVAITDWFPNPDPENARYLLSAMAQVIGTVFVLTVAIMQAVGGSELMGIGNLVSRREFKIAAGVSFLGIMLPLICLYFKLFCTWSAICLGLAAANLLIIGWFVWRIAPEQAAAKSLVHFKKEAFEALNLDSPSDVIRILSKIAQRAKEKLPEAARDEDNICDECKTIKDIILYLQNRSDEVWSAAIKLLIELDEMKREGEKDHFIPYCSTESLQEIDRTLTSVQYPRFKPDIIAALHSIIEDYFTSVWSM